MDIEELIKELEQHKEVMEVTLCMKASRDKDFKYPKVLKALDKSIKSIKLLEKAVEELENCYGRDTELTEEIRELLND